MPQTESPNVTTTSGTAMGAASTCSSRKKSGNARNAASGVSADRPTQRASSATSHTTRAHVGKVTTGGGDAGAVAGEEGDGEHRDAPTS